MIDHTDCRTEWTDASGRWHGCDPETTDEWGTRHAEGIHTCGCGAVHTTTTTEESDHDDH